MYRPRTTSYSLNHPCSRKMTLRERAPKRSTQRNQIAVLMPFIPTMAATSSSNLQATSSIMAKSTKVMVTPKLSKHMRDRDGSPNRLQATGSQPYHYLEACRGPPRPGHSSDMTDFVRSHVRILCCAYLTSPSPRTRTGKHVNMSASIDG